MAAPESKQSMRKRMLEARRNLDAGFRAKADASIRDGIAKVEQFRGFPLVAAYASDGSEPDLAPLLKETLKEGRRVCVPRHLQGGDYEMAELRSLESLVLGNWGMKEPGPDAKRVCREDLKNAVWLVPGVAFDGKGGRLGRGKGVYDRLLAGGCGFSIGVFYECQRCERLPSEGHDFSLDMVVTEAGAFKGRGQ